MSARDPLAVRAVVALHRWLTHLCPSAFRARFGVELHQTALAAARAAQRRGELLRFAVGAWLGVLGTAVRLHGRGLFAAATPWLVLVACLLGAGVGWLDLNAEEVQPAVLGIGGGAFVLSMLRPRAAWLWWLLLGASIPTAHAIGGLCGVRPPYEVAPGSTLLAFVPALLGAVLGAVASVLVRAHRVDAPPRMR